MKRFLEKFAITPDEEAVRPYFEAAKIRLQKEGNEIFNFEKYGIYTYMAKDLAAVRDALALDADNALFAYFLHEVLKTRDRALLKEVCSPRADDKDERYDTLPVFSMLAEVPAMKAEHARRGIPADVSHDTACMFENQMQDFMDLNHHLGIRGYVFWMLSFLELKILRVGRFNLEYTTFGNDYEVFDTPNGLLIMPTAGRFHRSGQMLGSIGCEDEEGSFEASLTETEDAFIGYPVVKGLCKNEKITLKKSDCRRILSKGDKAISVHIPSGGPMTEEACRTDLRRGGEIIKECLGDFKAFYCSSWLLDPQIPGLLGKETNLTRFGNRYERAPIKSGGGGVFEYVFLTSSKTPLEELKAETSFAKTVKAHLISGGHIYGAVGVFKTEDLYK